MKRTFRYHLSRLWWTSVLVFILCYFLYYFFFGTHGYYARCDLEKQLAETQAHLEVMKRKYDDLAHRVSLLKNESLDKDMLDERVRARLGYAEKDDIILLEE
ncbi:MAG: hypothetical protein C0582_02730 [Alphaproteobacteria bacterium]|nr:MAG: hypothetical protein C0582_02730 [Alphaproteobacteria bacterium]